MTAERVLSDDPRLLDPAYFTESFLTIKTKEQKLLPFLLNPVQKSIAKRMTHPLMRNGINYRIMRRGIRDLILKGRQHGATTQMLAFFYHDTISNESTHTKVIAHDKTSASEMLNTIRLFHALTPPWQAKPRIGRDNAGVIEFPGLGSKITISVVGDSARSQTVHNLLCTEIAFWQRMEKTMSAVLESVPRSGNVVCESTPNGIGGWMYSKIIESRGGNTSWRLAEYPWFLNKKYQIPLSRGEKMEPYAPDEIAIIMKYNLTPEQIKWRRWKIGETSARMFAQEYECDFLQSGTPVFNYYDYLQINPLDGYLRDLFQGKEGGLSIMYPPMPGRRYVIGADVAEGLANGDFDVATVVDKETGYEVAKLRGHWPIDVYAEKTVELMEMYNWAVCAVERNNHGHAMLQRMKQLLADPAVNKMSRLYYWRDGTHGWVTSSLTKPLMITDLEEALRKGYAHPSCQNTIDELSSYEWKVNGSTGGAEGIHDDSVMALAIAYQARNFVVVDEADIKRGGVRVIG